MYRGLESSWVSRLTPRTSNKVVSGRSCNQKPLWSDQGTGRKSKSRGNNLRSLQMCVWLEWEALPKCACAEHYHHDLILCRSEVTQVTVETLTLFQRHFRLTCRDSILILQVKTPYSSLIAVSSYVQYLSILYNVFQVGQAIMFPSIWLSCLAALLAGILIHSSDCPSLCCTAVQERRTARALHFSLAQVSTQEIATQNLFWDTMSSDALVFQGKSNTKWWLKFFPTPNPPIVCALEGSQHCHLGVLSIEGTDLILLPLTQHGMQKITWAIANADVTWGKPYVCRFVDRSNKDEQGKSPTMTLNTDTKTKQESCYSARAVMYRRSYRYKCTKIVTKPLSLFRKRHRGRQNVYSCRKLERIDLFGDLSSACSSQIWPWWAVNKQKQANSAKQRIRECRGTFHPTYFSYGPSWRYFACLQRADQFFESICWRSNLSCTASDPT